MTRLPVSLKRMFGKVVAENIVGATCFITKNAKKGEVYMQRGSKSCHNDSLAFFRILDASN